MTPEEVAAMVATDRTLALVARIIQTPLKQMEPDRFYTSSEVYGTSRYHNINLDQLYVEFKEMIKGEKWSNYTTFQRDEVPAVIRVLLQWYLDTEPDYAPPTNGKHPLAATDADAITSLDDHPF